MRLHLEPTWQEVTVDETFQGSAGGKFRTFSSLRLNVLFGNLFNYSKTNESDEILTFAQPYYSQT